MLLNFLCFVEVLLCSTLSALSATTDSTSALPSLSTQLFNTTERVENLTSVQQQFSSLPHDAETSNSSVATISGDSSTSASFPEKPIEMSNETLSFTTPTLSNTSTLTTTLATLSDSNVSTTSTTPVTTTTITTPVTTTTTTTITTRALSSQLASLLSSLQQNPVDSGNDSTTVSTTVTTTQTSLDTTSPTLTDFISTMPTTSTDPATASTKPATTSTEPATTSTKPATTSTEPATASTKPAITSTKPATTSTELATTSSPTIVATTFTTLSTMPTNILLSTTTSGTELLSTEISPTSSPPMERSYGWMAAPILGGILALIALFVMAYLIGKRKQQDQISNMRPLTESNMFYNENPSFVSDGVSQIPIPIQMTEFPAYVTNLHKDGDRDFHSQYQLLVKMSPQLERTASELPQNRNKNRYANILPSNTSRVKLVSSDEDYINASYIPGYISQREYIATQGPLPTTLADFWKMVWEQNVSTIVMLTNLREEGRDKCSKYWPSRSDEVYDDEFLCYGDVQVQLTSESTLTNYTVRTFQAQLGEVCRTIRQYHFLDWQDNSSPSDIEAFLNFTRDVRAWSNRNSPILVHCSSGAGRTGSYILVDRMLRVIDNGGSLDLLRVILEMRNHRTLMVQNESQYTFAHDAVKRAVEEKLFGASHHGFHGFDEAS